MSSSINASLTAGLIQTADTSGILNLQSNGTTIASVSSTGVAVTGTLSASGGIVKSSLPTGSVLQVVNGTYPNVTSSSSSTFADTGLTASITPTSATSKILVLVNHAGCAKNTSDTKLQLRLLRGASEIQRLGDLDGYTGSTANSYFGSVSSSYLDSPATTSSTTYKTQLASGSNTGTVAIGQYTSTFATSTITLMEIAA